MYRYKGGEKQKISIFRTLIKNADVMIFDEPTSALDDMAIKNFISEIKLIYNTKIIIIISHDSRLNVLSNNILSFDE